MKCKDSFTYAQPPDLSDCGPVRPVEQARVPRGPGTGRGHHPVSLHSIVSRLICRVRSHRLHANHLHILPSLHGMKKNKLWSPQWSDTTFLRPTCNVYEADIAKRSFHLKSPILRMKPHSCHKKYICSMKWRVHCMRRNSQG